MAEVGEVRRVHLRLAAELLDPFGDALGMLLLFTRMLLEFLLDRLRVDAGGHEVVELIAERADDLRGERLVENPDRLLAIELIVGSHRSFGNMLARTLAERLDLLQVGHRPVSSCPRLSTRRDRAECVRAVGAGARREPGIAWRAASSGASTH